MADDARKAAGWAIVMGATWKALEVGVEKLIGQVFDRAGKALNDFGGADNPLDELGYNTLLYYLRHSESAGVEVLVKWLVIEHRVQARHGDGVWSDYKRQAFAGKRRVKWTAMSQGTPPIISVRNDDGTQLQVPDPKWMPIGCWTMLLATEIYDGLVEYGEDNAQLATEDFLRECGFNIPKEAEHKRFERIDNIRSRLSAAPETVATQARDALQSFTDWVKQTDEDFGRWADGFIAETNERKERGKDRGPSCSLGTLFSFTD